MSDDIRSDQYKVDRLHINGKKPDWFQDEYFDEGVKMMVPRIRGRVAKGDDNKWYFETSLWDFTAENRIGEPWIFGPWENETEAREELKICVQKMCIQVEKFMGKEPSDKYLDMKNGGILRPWKEHS